MPMQDVMNNRIERFAYIIQQRNRNRLRFRGRRFNYTDSFRRYELENQRIRQVRNIERKREKITEFYNLIYEYKNDCLTAGVKYKKTYYKDRDLEPTEDFMFSIKLVPLAAIDQKFAN